MKVSPEPAPRCRVIAVLDDNHNGSPERARQLIDAARRVGADGVKFRQRTSALAAVRQVLEAPATEYAGLGASYGEALQAIRLSPAVVEELIGHADRLQVVVAPYDLDAYAELRDLAIAQWQIDPAVTTHLPMFEALSGSGRPILCDTTGCTEAEVRAIVDRLAPPVSDIGDIGEVTLLHGVGVIRTSDGIADVAHMAGLRRFGCPVGFRDCGLDISRALVAVCLGATVVEKPLTLDRRLPGPDHRTALLPEEFAQFVASLRELESILASGVLRDPVPAELDEIERSRASVVTSGPIPRGTALTPDLLALKPPFRGLSPSYVRFLIGRRAAYDLGADEHVTFGMLE